MTKKNLHFYIIFIINAFSIKYVLCTKEGWGHILNTTDFSQQARAIRPLVGSSPIPPPSAHPNHRMQQPLPTITPLIPSTPPLVVTTPPVQLHTTTAKSNPRAPQQKISFEKIAPKPMVSFATTDPETALLPSHDIAASQLKVKATAFNDVDALKSNYQKGTIPKQTVKLVGRTATIAQVRKKTPGQRFYRRVGLIDTVSEKDRLQAKDQQTIKDLEEAILNAEQEMKSYETQFNQIDAAGSTNSIMTNSLSVKQQEKFNELYAAENATKVELKKLRALRSKIARKAPAASIEKHTSTLQALNVLPNKLPNSVPKAINDAIAENTRQRNDLINELSPEEKQLWEEFYNTHKQLDGLNRTRKRTLGKIKATQKDLNSMRNQLTLATEQTSPITETDN